MLGRSQPQSKGKRAGLSSPQGQSVRRDCAQAVAWKHPGSMALSRRDLRSSAEILTTAHIFKREGEEGSPGHSCSLP
jgi:hypothetical protein